MEAHGLSVRLKPSRTNFVTLPSDLVNQLFASSIRENVQDVIVELEWKNKRSGPPVKGYAGWSGFTSEEDQSIEIDPAFASALNLSDKVKVEIHVKLQAPLATTVEVEPLTASDWETVELHAGALEEKLIYQTRAVLAGGNLVIYPSSTITATLKILKITPNPSEKYARLSPDAEVIVAPKSRRSQQKNKSQSVRSVSSSRRTHENTPFTLSRGISLPHPLFREISGNRYAVYANFDEIYNVLEQAEYVYVSIIPGPEAAPKNKTAEDKPIKKIAAQLINDPDVNGIVGLSRLLSISLGVQDTVGNIVKIEKALKPNYTRNPTLVINPIITESKPEVENKLSLSNENAQKEKELKRQKLKQTKALVKEAFTDLGLNNTVISNGAVLPTMKGLPEGGIIEIKDKIAWILPVGETKISIDIGDEQLVPRSQVPPSISEKVASTQKPIGLNKLLKQIERNLKKGRVGAIVYGASGSGKTLLVNEIASRFHSKGFYVLNIECNDFVREGAQNIKEKIETWLNKTSWYGPAILILEGIGNLFPAETEQTDSTQSRQLSEFFIQAVNKVMKSRNLIILATARSTEAVNSLLLSSHCIEESFTLRAPTKDARTLQLESFLKDYDLELAKDFDASELAAETEGYLPSDLKVLVDRIHHEAIYKSAEDNVPLSLVSNELFNKAIKGYTPSNLRGVKLQKSTTSWVDIGGLTEAKSVLLETLEWPTKYAPIFKNATLRLRSGILLYGYPGCGKTLLASAVAGQCGLNFISVKGPEILNKYIGASEQSVRELFERAQAAKPCILFFDEFDSIAPKRGHDSTGVTDRVVNQMLTQMDGAEGLDGVYVLAATSRPDLIDSALLRPGRLDKSVICDLPNYEDRLSILQSITRKMSLADDVSLEYIAEHSEGFSGADMQALGYNAYLGAVHERLEAEKAESKGEATSTSNKPVHEFFQISLKQLEETNNEVNPHERTKLLAQIEPLMANLSKSLEKAKTAGKEPSKKDPVTIQQKDFIGSLRDTKPSISVSEKNKLGNIYSKFVSARDGNLQDGSSSNEVGARTTLM